MAETSTVVLSGIGQIYVTAHDLDRAVVFYRDTLGLKFLFQVPKMAFFDCGGVRLMLGPPDKPEFDHPASIIYYKVEDIGAAHRVLSEREVKVLEEPELVAKLPDHDLWLAFFQDTEGNAFALMSEVRPPASGR